MTDWAEGTVVQFGDVTPYDAEALPPPPALSKVYISSLHADTSQEDLLSILRTVTPAAVHRLFVSDLHRKRRWAKFDMDASLAAQFIDRYNFVAGILHAQSRAEYARS